MALHLLNYTWTTLLIWKTEQQKTLVIQSSMAPVLKLFNLNHAPSVNVAVFWDFTDFFLNALWNEKQSAFGELDIAQILLWRFYSDVGMPKQLFKSSRSHTEC